MSADDQAAGTDLAEAERRVTELAGWLRLISAPGRTGKVTLEREDAAALVAMVAEYDRRGTELDRLAVRAQQHANATSWAAREAVAHMQKGDDLADQRAALSSLLRGMARRVSSWRETANVLLDLGGPELAATIRDLNATDEAGSVDLRELSRAVAAGAVPPATAGTDWAQVATRVARERGSLKTQVAAVRALADRWDAANEPAGETLREVLDGPAEAPAINDAFGTTCAECGEAITDEQPSIGESHDGPLHEGCGEPCVCGTEFTCLAHDHDEDEAGNPAQPGEAAADRRRRRAKELLAERLNARAGSVTTTPAAATEPAAEECCCDCICEHHCTKDPTVIGHQGCFACKWCSCSADHRRPAEAAEPAPARGDIQVGDVVEFEDDGGVLGKVTAIVVPGRVRVRFPNGTTDAPVADLAVVRRAVVAADEPATADGLLVSVWSLHDRWKREEARVAGFIAGDDNRWDSLCRQRSVDYGRRAEELAAVLRSSSGSVGSGTAETPTDDEPTVLVCTCTTYMRGRGILCEGCRVDDANEAVRAAAERRREMRGSVTTTPDPASEAQLHRVVAAHALCDSAARGLLRLLDDSDVEERFNPPTAAAIKDAMDAVRAALAGSGREDREDPS